MKQQCPECRSPKVTELSENMVCLECGFKEYLYDYPNACDMGYLPEKRSEVIIHTGKQVTVHFHQHLDKPRKKEEPF